MGAGISGVRCRPTMPVAGCRAARVLAAVGLLVAVTGFWACSGVVAFGRGAAVMGEVVVVEVDEVAVVVEVGESARDALVE